MSPKKSIQRLIKKYSQQSIVQQVGNGSTGSFQVVNSGRNVYVTQQSSHSVTQQSTQIFSSDEISSSEAIKLLEEIEKIVNEAASSSPSQSEIIEEAMEYINWAKKEAQKKDPYKPIILANLEAAVSWIKNLINNPRDRQEDDRTQKNKSILKSFRNRLLWHIFEIN